MLDFLRNREFSLSAAIRSLRVCFALCTCTTEDLLVSNRSFAFAVGILRRDFHEFSDPQKTRGDPISWLLEILDSVLDLDLFVLIISLIENENGFVWDQVGTLPRQLPMARCSSAQDMFCIGHIVAFNILDTRGHRFRLLKSLSFLWKSIFSIFFQKSNSELLNQQIKSSSSPHQSIAI